MTVDRFLFLPGSQTELNLSLAPENLSPICHPFDRFFVTPLPDLTAKPLGLGCIHWRESQVGEIFIFALIFNNFQPMSRISISKIARIYLLPIALAKGKSKCPNLNRLE
jgi:hypothetical protein